MSNLGKVLKGKKKTALLLLAALVIIGIFSIFSKSLGMQHYEELDFVTGLVTANKLNVRQGPGLTYKVITQIDKNEYIRVFAKVGNWYIIQTEKDFIGAVSTEYVKPIRPDTNTEQEKEETPVEIEVPSTQDEISDELTADEKEVFDLINAEREKAGLKPLEIDKEVQNVARIKAQDMVDNKYFSHTSQIYGSPFDMLKNFKVNYKSAGENIAGNSSNSAAVTAWMNSEGHKANILNNAYNLTGIGVVKSPTYGKIYVQMFVGR